LAWGCGFVSTVSGQRPVAGCGECGDKPSGFCATELVMTSKLHMRYIQLDRAYSLI
jgi:hypothetical protein